jgi:hypothetical protein
MIFAVLGFVIATWRNKALRFAGIRDRPPYPFFMGFRVMKIPANLLKVMGVFSTSTFMESGLLVYGLFREEIEKNVIGDVYDFMK